jgi:hypothetical protein
VRQFVDDRQNSVRTLNVELRFERALGKKISADASHPHARKLGIEKRSTDRAAVDHLACH